MRRAMAESEKLYHEIKNHFLTKDRPQIVIQISTELLMNQWAVFPVVNVDEMSEIRCKFIRENKDFAGFIWHEGQYHFYFVDSNMAQDIDIDTGRIFDYYDFTFNELDMNAVANELRQLLQGS